MRAAKAHLQPLKKRTIMSDDNVVRLLTQIEDLCTTFLVLASIYVSAVVVKMMLDVFQTGKALQKVDSAVHRLLGHLYAESVMRYRNRLQPPLRAHASHSFGGGMVDLGDGMDDRQNNAIPAWPVVALGDDRETEDANNQCCHCHDLEKRCAAVPCGHVVLCAPCANEAIQCINRDELNSYVRCPMCRTNVERYIKVYM